MPNLTLFSFELLVYFIFALCLRHAWKAGAPAVLQLSCGVLFGLLLELATIRQLNAYHYGHFAIMILDAPLAVGFAWGSMIYSARLFSNATNLSEWARPLLDALLVLNIDLSIDAIAIRLGMWDWGKGLSDQYFGVPYANFWAWFWVVFSFSAGLRLLVNRPGWVGRWLAPFGALLIGLAGVLFTNLLITLWIPRSLYTISVAAVFLAALAVILYLRPRLLYRPASLTGWVPLLMHLYFLAAGLLAGYLVQIPFLLVVSILMFGISLLVHNPSRNLAPQV